MSGIYTIGHSTHSIGDFIAMLRGFGVQCLVDIRTIPGSRHNPQFGRGALEASLREEGIDYIYLKELGGLRKAAPVSVNLGWRNASFRNFADYMQTPAFERGLEELIRLGKEKTIAIMCAEAVPWRCHRSLVADALLARGIQARHIMGLHKDMEHSLTSFARVDGLRVSYPEAAAGEHPPQ